jgi:hypothetical protein
MEAEIPAGVGLMLLWSREGKFMLSTFLVAAIAIGVAGCGAATTTTVTTTVTTAVTTAVTAPQRTVTVNRTVTAKTPTTPDASAFLERSLTDKVPGGSGHSTRSFLENSYPGATVQATGAQCVEAGTTQHYQCTVGYTVSGASDPSQDGSYTLGATGSCDNAGNCQTLEDAVATASRQ